MVAVAVSALVLSYSAYLSLYLRACYLFYQTLLTIYLTLSLVVIECCPTYSLLPGKTRWVRHYPLLYQLTHLQELDLPLL